MPVTNPLMMIAVLTVTWMTAWWCSAARKAWADWRGTIAKLPILRGAFYGALRRAGAWLFALVVLALLAGWIT